jgi:hydroxymethylglutaryl-CoA reductase (NADPH)
MQSSPLETIIPTRFVGPIKIQTAEFNEEIKVPLATLEAPLWLSVNRGASVSRLTKEGIRVAVLRDFMTRSILVEVRDLVYAEFVKKDLQTKLPQLKAIASATGEFIKFEEYYIQVVANLLFIRFSFTTGDAAGHNMVTKASEALLNWLLKQYPELSYVSLSGNICTDKKVSAVNNILGRGKYVSAEITIPSEICQNKLHTTPDKIVALNIKKNLLGSILAGSLQSANAHFANMLLAIYLATGQDAANIIEGSQGVTYAEKHNNDLYFSVTLPNLIVVTVGNGKDLPFAKKNLDAMGCYGKRQPGQNARRLAIITAATILCGELSLLAALTNPSELMQSHLRLERNK